MVRRSAEIAQAGFADGIGQANRLAAMQVLGCRIGSEAAALDENDAAADAGEAPCQRNAGGAGAHDA